MTNMGKHSKALLVAGFLITGSINTLTKKFQLLTCAPTEYLGGDTKNCEFGSKRFEKPWTQNMQMFMGESICMAAFLFTMRRAVNARELPLQDTQSGPSTGEGAPQRRPAPFYIFLLPAMCDVLGTGVGGVGMLYISASVWQMMRGSMIIFTSILSVVFLKRKLFAYNWLAVCISAAGLGLVGGSAILDGSSTSQGSIPLGIMFTVISQMFAATQFVVEEKFIKQYGAPPPQIVGSEGLWGILLMCGVLTAMYFIPGKDGGSYENVFDSLHMLSSSRLLLLWVLTYLLSISVFNFLGVTITGKLSAVHRTINDALRTAIVWSVQTILYYTGCETYGTPLTPHSWMQMLGFVFLLCGSLANHQILKFPFLTYPTSAEQPHSQIALASPSHAQGMLCSPKADQSKATP
jgi:hypothetical protein